MIWISSLSMCSEVQQSDIKLLQGKLRTFWMKDKHLRHLLNLLNEVRYLHVELYKAFSNFLNICGCYDFSKYWKLARAWNRWWIVLMWTNRLSQADWGCKVIALLTGEESSINPRVNIYCANNLSTLETFYCVATAAINRCEVALLKVRTWAR